MDDIATPGSFWLNVCHERDDVGNKVDPVTLIKEYQGLGTAKTTQEATAIATDNTIENKEPSDAELAAILADMDPL